MLIVICFHIAAAVKEFHTVDLDVNHGCLELVGGQRLPYTIHVPPQSILLPYTNIPVPATRHHIIPLSKLSNFYNQVIRTNPGTPLGNYLHNRVASILSSFRDNNQFGVRRDGSSLAPHHYLTVTGPVRDFQPDYNMLAAFTWMPGNLFYGPPPGRRLNDPGDGFDFEASGFVRPDTYQRMARLYVNMHRYISQPDYRTQENVERIFSDLDYVNRRATPYEFDAEDWEGVFDETKNKMLYYVKGSRSEPPRRPRRSERSTSGMVDFSAREYLDAAQAVCQKLIGAKTGQHLHNLQEKNKGKRCNPTSMVGIPAATAAAGAAAGSFIPGVGTVVGAVVGFVSGNIIAAFVTIETCLS